MANTSLFLSHSYPPFTLLLFAFHTPPGIPLLPVSPFCPPFTPSHSFTFLPYPGPPLLSHPFPPSHPLIFVSLFTLVLAHPSFPATLFLAYPSSFLVTPLLSFFHTPPFTSSYPSFTPSCSSFTLHLTDPSCPFFTPSCPPFTFLRTHPSCPSFTPALFS